jgi:aminoglycoside phosphotransferase (APT) family kinase protein
MTALAVLTARIRAAFPGLAFEAARRNDIGDDHEVVILDDRWVFRFLRPGRGRRDLFAGERRLLDALAGRTPFAIPAYAYVSQAGDFGGYRLIEGDELTVERFAALAAAARTKILNQLAVFLREVHATAPATIANAAGVVPHEWSGGQFRDRWVSERRAMIADIAPALIGRADRFYDALAAMPPPAREVLTHGDLSADHMLLAPAGDRLAGVIDFGDACLGDPAYDLAFFFAYGEKPARQIVRLYDPQRSDPGLAGRARMHFLRFAIEQLRHHAPAVRISRVEASLTRAGF